MYLHRFNSKFIILAVSLFMAPVTLNAWTMDTWTVGLEEAARSIYNGTSTAESRLFVHERINEINDMALSGDLPDNLYQSAQGDFFDRNYADLKKAATQEGLDISMKKPEHFEPGTDTDAPLTRQSGSDTDITLEKLQQVEKNYKKNIKQHYKEAGLKAPADIPDTNTDILVDPDATSEFKACTDHINNNGGTAYTDPDAVRAEIKIAKDQPISIKEASARTNQTKKLANKKAAEARSLRKEASLLEKTNPQRAKKLRTQAQLADSQASKYINRTNNTTDVLRKQHGLAELPFDEASSLDKAIKNLDKNTGKGRSHLTEKEARIIGNMQKHASEKASQKFIDSLGDIAKARPHTAKDVQKAIAKQLNTMTPSAQGRAIENLERKVGKNFTKNIVKEAKILKGIKVRTTVKPKPMTTSKKFIHGLTKPRTLGATGKKFVAIGYKAVNVTMIAGAAYFMGKDGVYHALKNVTADQTEFEFIVDVYKEAAWHGTGLGYAFEEAQAEEIAMWKREIDRGEPSDSMRKHVTITVGKTIVYLGRDIVVGTLTLPYVFLEYLVGFEDAERREKYSIAFLAEVRRQIRSKKEFQNALDIANEDGIAFNDQRMYLNCMCSDCGGSLGGFFRPEFQGGGYGPCQCNGPLTIWKTPISSNPEQRATCKERIKQKNNRLTDARMDELHKIAMAENAKSVAKELQEVKRLLQVDESLNKATELFINIQPLLYPKDTQDMRKVIEPKLANKANMEIQKGDLKETIKILEQKNRVAGLPDNRTYPMAVAKKWLKSWKSAKKTFFPEISNYLKERKLTQAKNKFNILRQWMQRTGENKESHFPPAYKDPDYQALTKMTNDKKQERMKDIDDAWSKSKEYVLQRNPKAAVKEFEEVLEKWEHTKADKTQLQKELNNRLKIFVHNAQAADTYGNKLVEKGDFSGAVDSYTKSLGIQKDPIVQRKLDDLLERMSSSEQSESEERKKEKIAKADKGNHSNAGPAIDNVQIKRVGATSTTPLSTINDVKYIGCYKETGHNEKSVPTMENRVMKGYNFGGNMTTTTCTEACSQRGFKYAGLQYANQCFCDNSYDRFGKADNCDMPCSGNKNEMCGGAWANSVYRLTNILDTTKVNVSTIYTHVPNAAISGHNSKHLSQVNVQDCKTACDKESWCQSFDYYKGKSQCDLSNKTADEVGGLKTTYGGNPYDHYTKKQSLPNVKKVRKEKILIVTTDENVYPNPSVTDPDADSNHYVIDGNESNAWARLFFKDSILNRQQIKSITLKLNISTVKDGASRNGITIYYGDIVVARVPAVTRGEVVEVPLDISKIKRTNGRLELILKASGTDAAYIESKASGHGAELKIISN